jgi:hypothetical protein
MRYQKSLRHGFGLNLIVVIALSVLGCGAQQPESACEAPPQEGSASTDPKNLWKDATMSTIGRTYGWTNRVELADINSDDLVDILFANGGNYDMPGKPDHSKVFLNQGPDQSFEDATRQVLPKAMLARVIKVRDVNADGSPDILVGTTYQTQSQLYLGDGSGGQRIRGSRTYPDTRPRARQQESDHAPRLAQSGIALEHRWANTREANAMVRRVPLEGDDRRTAQGELHLPGVRC